MTASYLLTIQSMNEDQLRNHKLYIQAMIDGHTKKLKAINELQEQNKFKNQLKLSYGK